jgi:hypothetical protein
VQAREVRLKPSGEDAFQLQDNSFKTASSQAANSAASNVQNLVKNPRENVN